MIHTRPLDIGPRIAHLFIEQYARPTLWNGAIAWYREDGTCKDEGEDPGRRRKLPGRLELHYVGGLWVLDWWWDIHGQEGCAVRYPEVTDVRLCRGRLHIDGRKWIGGPVMRLLDLPVRGAEPVPCRPVQTTLEAWA